MGWGGGVDGVLVLNGDVGLYVFECFWQTSSTLLKYNLDIFCILFLCN